MTSRKQIQSFADAIAREFNPERIILFGSDARGETTADSDVDLLVIMPRDGKTRHQQAVEIRQRVTAGFPIDRRFGVERLETFGSALNAGFDSERSDLDFLVRLPRNYDFGPWMSRLQLPARSE